MAEVKAKSYNMRNPAVKRILQEVKEMAREQSEEYKSMPLEEDIFEWQFAVHGPKDSEFEGGIYHGRITLPPEYPFKPPSFMLLTPSGRFEVQTKICLSISNHHPEHWQPSWSVRTALVALIAFMPTKPNGAIGSLEYTKKERRALAIKSRQQAPQFGSPERQAVIQQIHETMLKTAPPVPTTPLVEDEPSGPGGEEERVPQAPAAAAVQPKQPSTPEPSGSAKAGASPSDSTKQVEVEVSSGSSISVPAPAAPELRGPSQQAAGPSAQSSLGVAEGKQPGAVTAAASSSSSEALEGAIGEVHSPRRGPPRAVHDVPITWNNAPNNSGAVTVTRQDSETLQERILSVVAAVLVIAILVILGQKIANAYTGVALAGSESEL